MSPLLFDVVLSPLLYDLVFSLWEFYCTLAVCPVTVLGLTSSVGRLQYNEAIFNV